MVSILVKTPDYSPWFSGIHEGVKWTHAVVAEGDALLHLLHGRSVLLRGGLDSGHGRGGVSPATGIRIRLTNLEQERNEKHIAISTASQLTARPFGAASLFGSSGTGRIWPDPLLGVAMSAPAYN